MPIAPELMRHIDGLLATGKGDRETLAALRSAAAGVTASRCDWEDLKDETPFRTYPDCLLFLVDGRDHCWRITDDPSFATALVLTPKAPEGVGK